ncbi:MAG: LysM peptidoglycan-binding domain-containing protein [Myxococcota bacterium]|nr:LysM peptidoglycan-binding domain-containing protein [Myxococcota bacterium]
MLTLLLLLACSDPAPPTHTVVRGDTLSKLAATHGVSVAQLKEWNGLSSDRIDVGQVLVVGEGSAEPVAAVPSRSSSAPRGVSKPRSAPKVQSGGRTLPPEKPCIPLPTDAEIQGMEAGFSGAAGLSRAQVKSTMDAALPGLSVCIEGPWPEGEATLEITAGCNGRVSAVRVVDSGTLEPALLECIQQELRFVGFPAHDLPDGERFVYPIQFSGG